MGNLMSVHASNEPEYDWGKYPVKNPERGVVLRTHNSSYRELPCDPESPCFEWPFVDGQLPHKGEIVNPVMCCKKCDHKNPHAPSVPQELVTHWCCPLHGTGKISKEGVPIGHDSFNCVGAARPCRRCLTIVFTTDTEWPDRCMRCCPTKNTEKLEPSEDVYRRIRKAEFVIFGILRDINCRRQFETLDVLEDIQKRPEFMKYRSKVLLPKLEELRQVQRKMLYEQLTKKAVQERPQAYLRIYEIFGVDPTPDSVVDYVMDRLTTERLNLIRSHFKPTLDILIRMFEWAINMRYLSRYHLSYQPFAKSMEYMEYIECVSYKSRNTSNAELLENLYDELQAVSYYYNCLLKEYSELVERTVVILTNDLRRRKSSIKYKIGRLLDKSSRSS